MNDALLTVEDLWVRFHTRTRLVEAVRGISFSVGREKVGIVGESGSGKTVTGRSILGLVRPPGEVAARRLEFDGRDILNAPEKTMRAIRGDRISMVMQDPKFSLNPVMKVGDQIAEAYRVHSNASAREARERALEMLETVKIRDAKRVYGAYPHEVSGGMGQRIMIAMMMIPDPDLMIADEPTSALDVTVQMQVLSILDDLVTERGMGLIFISHDLNLVSSFCDRVIIMYAGQIVETCRARDLENATHPYTRGLLASLPRVDEPVDRLAVLNREASWETGESVDAFYG
jgi:peptide/nickel transport system ATP-binding protein